jgi:hypothetical protein
MGHQYSLSALMLFTLHNSYSFRQPGDYCYSQCVKPRRYLISISYLILLAIIFPANQILGPSQACVVAGFSPPIDRIVRTAKFEIRDRRIQSISSLLQPLTSVTVPIWAGSTLAFKKLHDGMDKPRAISEERSDVWLLELQARMQCVPLVSHRRVDSLCFTPNRERAQQWPKRSFFSRVPKGTKGEA